MKKLSHFHEGDKFRPAHARQKSVNGLMMPRDVFYWVRKIFPQLPGLYICERQGSHDKKYSLYPGTPVLYPNEPLPSDEEVLVFLNYGKKKRIKVIGYKILWDGITPLENMLAPQAIALMNMILAVGGKEFNSETLHDMCNRYYHRFWHKPLKRDASQIWKFYRRTLINSGLIAEVIDHAPIPDTVREAGLEETIYEREGTSIKN